MVIDDLALVRDQHSSVPEASYRGGRSFIESDMSENTILGACLLNALHLWAINEETFSRELFEEGVIVYRR